MSNKISINDCYRLMNIKKILYIEDDIQCETSCNAILYDLIRSKDSERKVIIEKISNFDSKLAEKLNNLFTSIEKKDVKFEWDQIPNRNIEWYLKHKELPEIQKIYDSISEEEILKCKYILNRFALGIKYATVMVPDLVNAENQNNQRLPIRLYDDFLAEEQESIKNEISYCIARNENFVCIIDDQLKQQSRSRDIIEFLSKIEKANQFGTYILLSSKNKESNSRFDSEIYIDYIFKKDPELNELIIKALLNSNYSTLIKKMKKLKIEAVEKSYDYAIGNKNIARYLAGMAQEEGVTNYNVLLEWLNLRENYYWNSEEFQEDIMSIIRLSSLINKVYEEKKDINLKDTENIRNFEEYNYNINKFYTHIMPGDIFCINSNENDDYYILIGQECDFSLRKMGGKVQRKTSKCILLKVEILPESYIPKTKQSNGYEKILLGNFRCKDSRIVTIRINCSKAYLIDDMILDLCSYRSTGDSFLDLDENLNLEKKYMITKSMSERYSNIQEKFKIINEINDKLKSIITLEEVISTASNTIEDIVPLMSFTRKDNCIEFPVKRICRLKRYINLLNKMYSDYKWRLAFDTINLDDIEYIEPLIIINEVERTKVQTGILLTNNRRKNDEKDKRTWYIEKEQLVAMLEEFGVHESDLDGVEENSNKIILKKRSGRLANGKVFYTKICEGIGNYKLIIKIENVKSNLVQVTQPVETVSV